MATLVPYRSRPHPGAGPVLLVSSVGGHFTELELVVDALRIDRADRHWAVARHIQTEDRLAGEDVTWSPLVQSREYGKAMRNLRFAMALHRRLRPRLLVSTGAAQAAPHLIAAARSRTPIVYVESVARLDGPSITGRLAASLPNVRLLAPQPGWPKPWAFELDAFSAFEVRPTGTTSPVTSVLVALGSEQFPFDRAVHAVERVLPPTVEVTWQVGNTDCADGLARNRWLTTTELTTAMARADVVITHAGAGSILTALAAGKVPVVLPRRAGRGEHRDDHQVRMAQGLAARGLAVDAGSPEALSLEHLRLAGALQVTRSSQPISVVGTDQIVA
ncbi:glycosyltransferase [Nocardioides panacisoli]|uniref:Glycosyltransferase n=1 Tax=Nocardioides panacisoli TaxID=627624 RepID=A0ABP7IHJ6_9ACTN